ncbi:hypothetical protein BH09BAC2_BH09BAC2_23860 [soil metagenome]
MANVTLKKDHAAADQACVCEIRLEIPGNDDFVKKTAEEYETAVMDATDTLLNVIHKRKSKQVNSRQADQQLLPEDFISTDI